MSPSNHRHAGDALLALMAEHAVDVSFGIVSIHNQPMVDALAHATRFVPVRHEAAAVNAADAYARVSGGLGVALTSTGTGAGNAAGSLIEALSAGSPVLHVTGQIDAAYLGQGRGVIHETRDQRAMLDAVSKRAFTVVDPDDTASVLWEAAREALRPPRGPVSVEIAIDVQYRPGRPAQPTPAPVLPAPDPEAIAQAAELLMQARRPVMWLGGGAVPAAEALRRLVERHGVAVFTSNAGRASIDEDHVQVVGNFATTPGGQVLLDEADLIISVGTHFRSNETRNYQLRLPTPHVQIDIDPSAIGRVYPVDLGLCGESSAVLERLDLACGAGSRNVDWLERTARTRATVRQELRRDIGPYVALCDAVRTSLPTASPFVRDVTISATSWGHRLMPLCDPRTNVSARGGGIGQALAMGLGASIARPSVPSLAMIGDGGFLVHLGELATVAQERPWLVVVLFNDGGYGVLRPIQEAQFGRRSGVDLVNPDFSALAGSLGLAHRHLRHAHEASSVLAEAVALRAPVVVEVDCASFGPLPTAFVQPVAVVR